MKKPAVKIAAPAALIEVCRCVVACKGKCRRPRLYTAAELQALSAYYTPVKA